MAKLTVPGSRADLLLTLARLALPDAIRRANQPLAVVILLSVLSLGFATVATLGLLPAIFAIESDALRGNLLSLTFCSVTALALLAQVALRAPVTWLLDLEDFLRLPVGFRDLYGLRFGLSTIGYWLPVLGPAAAYLTVMRSGGVSGVPVTLLGILSLIWIFGRTAAILSLFVNHSVEGALGTLAMVVFVAACQGAILFGAQILVGEPDFEGIARTIGESAVLGGLGYTPPGLVAGMVHHPGLSTPNLARLAGLMAILGLLTLLEKRLLLRDCLEYPGGDSRVATGVVPLEPILRGLSHLTPMGVLTLLEIECLLRPKSARRVLATMVAFALVWVPALAGFAVGLTGLTATVLHAFRLEKQPPTCHVWRESLGLPLTVLRIFRATGRAPGTLTVLLLALTLCLTSFDWFGWRFFLVAFSLVLAGVLLGTAGHGLVQVYWPQRRAGPTDDPNGAKFAMSFLVAQATLIPAPISTILYILYERERLSALIAGLVAAAVLLLAAAAAYVARQWQARVLNARGRELLLADPPEPLLAISGRGPDTKTGSAPRSGSGRAAGNTLDRRTR